MPTPFTHLETAQRLLEDPALPDDVRQTLNSERPAFLLGSIAADARNSAGIRREQTHFYIYDLPSKTPAWREMLRRHPSMHPPHSTPQRVFIAGYAAHLAVDEVWSEDMMRRQIADREWAPWHRRFTMMHILLAYMDERDAARLHNWQPDTLLAATPTHWTSFLPDNVLSDWRDFVGGQLQPGGVSQTLNVFSDRIGLLPEDIREILDSPETMQRDLWQHITPAMLEEIEGKMYAFAREQLLRYWSESD